MKANIQCRHFPPLHPHTPHSYQQRSQKALRSVSAESWTEVKHCITRPQGRARGRATGKATLGPAGKKNPTPYLGKCEIHRSALEIQEKAGISGPTVPRGLGCVGVDVEVSRR